jgi:hypothetical protein
MAAPTAAEPALPGMEADQRPAEAEREAQAEDDGKDDGDDAGA